ncbi:hypothetical protein BDV95DRAFT_78947 [Massariosphaeria phaeospora]|uniref:Uncharacterized protein n=1 Tax=Massariosphaeria phaeospora TaxID=100035 RepID=A0A7C8MM60_9PLEO|nr:hypothetical protein BDV95DRAFT_78947 [Massariosphaeria phaeospora]
MPPASAVRARVQCRTRASSLLSSLGAQSARLEVESRSDVYISPAWPTPTSPTLFRSTTHKHGQHKQTRQEIGAEVDLENRASRGLDPDSTVPRIVAACSAEKAIDCMSRPLRDRHVGWEFSTFGTRLGVDMLGPPVVRKPSVWPDSVSTLKRLKEKQEMARTKSTVRHKRHDGSTTQTRSSS